MNPSIAAIHEAGHGVVGKVRGLGIKYLDVSSHEVGEAYYTNDVQRSDVENAFSYAMMAAAGPLAELKHRGFQREDILDILTGPWPPEWIGDFGSTRLTASNYEFEEAPIVEGTWSALLTYWRAVDAVAAPLEVRRRIEGDELNELLSDEIEKARPGALRDGAYRR